MSTYPFDKKPAFFPFVSAEVFFEAEDAEETEEVSAEAFEASLDAELDELLATA